MRGGITVADDDAVFVQNENLVSLPQKTRIIAVDHFVGGVADDCPHDVSVCISEAPPVGEDKGVGVLRRGKAHVPGPVAGAV